MNGDTFFEVFQLDWINDGSGSLNDFQNFIANSSFTNLQSVRFEGIGADDNYFSIDNINLSSSSVPEPSVMMLVGIGLLGFVMRKKI